MHGIASQNCDEACVKRMKATLGKSHLFFHSIPFQNKALWRIKHVEAACRKANPKGTTLDPFHAWKLALEMF